MEETRKKANKVQLIEIGAIVRRLRLARGISCNRFAKMMKVDGSQMSRFERGLMFPGYDVMKRIMAYFKIKLKVVVDGRVEVRCKQCLHRQTIEL